MSWQAQGGKEGGGRGCKWAKGRERDTGGGKRYAYIVIYVLCMYVICIALCISYVSN
jgi:hypothetical protein